MSSRGCLSASTLLCFSLRRMDLSCTNPSCSVSRRMRSSSLDICSACTCVWNSWRRRCSRPMRWTFSSWIFCTSVFIFSMRSSNSRRIFSTASRMCSSFSWNSCLSLTYLATAQRLSASLCILSSSSSCDTVSPSSSDPHSCATLTWSMWTSTVRCFRSLRPRSYFFLSSVISSCAVPSLALRAASCCCFSCRRSSCLRRWFLSSCDACRRVSMRVCSSFERSTRISICFRSSATSIWLSLSACFSL
mmetsp:Transcript_16234/g.37444  ORF Transcript_16234/g.37444 Transcript_16234/m.37444 type:complete len:247 (-) Transcript_16234:123-863(-)